MCKCVHAARAGLEAVAGRGLLSSVVVSSLAEADDILIALDFRMATISKNCLEGWMDDGQDLRPQLHRAVHELFTVFMLQGGPVVKMLGHRRHVAALREVLKESTTDVVHELSCTLEFVVQLPPELKAVALHSDAKRLAPFLEA